jgi:hypothetical protein
LRDPVGFRVGEVIEILLAAEDGDGDKVTVLVLNGEVGNEAGSLANVPNVAIHQRVAEIAGAAAQGVTPDDGVDRLPIALRQGRDHR